MIVVIHLCTKLFLTSECLYMQNYYKLNQEKIRKKFESKGSHSFNFPKGRLLI